MKKTESALPKHGRAYYKVKGRYVMESRDAEVTAQVKDAGYEKSYFYRVDSLSTRSYANQERTKANPKVMEFVAGVKKAFRGCEIVEGYEGGTESFRAYVYLPDDTFCMGYITIHDPAKYKWGDAVDSVDPSDLTYTVWSHTIDNNKYGRGKRERYSSATKDVNKAIKNAKKYLRRITHHELVKITREEYSEVTREEVTKLRRNSDLHTDTLGIKSYNVENTKKMQLYQELIHLLAMGTEFLDKDFAGNLMLLRDTVAAHDAGKHAQNSAVNYCVRVHEAMGKQVFSTAMLDGTSGNPNYSMNHQGNMVGDTVEYTEDTLPEWMSGKLSMLSMCEERDYVEGVGYRYDGNIFYVTN